MTAVEILKSLRRRWLYVVVALLLGGAGGVAAIVTATPQYQADSTVYFSVPFATSANDLAQGGNYAQQQLTSYAELATQPIVLDKVIAQLDLDITPNKLSDVVQTTVSKDSVLVTIAATDPSPDRAADIANGIADQLGKTVRSLSPKSESGDPTVDYAIAGEAIPPVHAVSPRKKIDLGAGLLAGLLVGVLAALIRDRADDRIWSNDDLGTLPVLGDVPFDKTASRKGRSPLIADWARESARAEAFRQIRTSLQFADVDAPIRTVAVTSSLSAEGKSGVSANLAVAFAEAGQRVLLVDADLRRPSIAKYFDLEGAVGLTNVLAGQVEFDDVVQRWGDRHTVSVLPAGAVPPNPSEIVGSQRMSRLLEDLRSRFDMIVIDTPPLLPVTDASIIATRVDGTLLIARHGKTRRAEIHRAVEALEAVDSRIAGVVLNRAPAKKRKDYGYYGAVTDRSLVLTDEQLNSVEEPVDSDTESVSPARAVGHPNTDKTGQLRRGADLAGETSRTV